MPEIKHTFLAGKMNKDFDERLVPNGEYRDAYNIQVKTSDGGNAGTVQNVLGNSLVFDGGYMTNETGTSSRVVASIPDEQANCIYFFISSPPITTNPSAIDGEIVYKDLIVRQNSNGTTDPIVTDIHAIVGTAADAKSGGLTENGPFVTISVDDASKYRKGMEVRLFTSSGASLLEPKTVIESVNTVANNIRLNKWQDADLTTCTVAMFIAEQVLEFRTDTLITGINILEDFIFWTDNKHEPKKINIKRCEEGTESFSSHTKLQLKNFSNGELKNFSEFYNVSEDRDWLRRDHITVIRKAPLNAPVLEMSSTSRHGDTEVPLQDSNFIEPSTGNLTGKSEGDIIVINLGSPSVSIYKSDIVYLDCDNPLEVDVPKRLKAIVESKSNSEIACRVISMPDNLAAAENEWTISLQESEPLFEFDLPRFAYRYKYEDNEYSSFSPWTEIAFLPSPFDYSSAKGYNLGMVNSLKQLTIKGWMQPLSQRPYDIKAVDILYKSSGSPVVYVIKTITRGKDDEWDGIQNAAGSITSVGEVSITSDLIHKAVPSNQILRAWDNVPRAALAQEVTGNRLLYGNYLQGYDINKQIGLNQSLVSNIISSDAEGVITPVKSAKSMRTYRFGIVFSDAYGRETPVIAIGAHRITSRTGTISTTNSDLYIPKSEASNANSFALSQVWSSNAYSSVPPAWATHFKYYVKETSAEYYNLVMSRWYNAEDGNVWISFNSADRNKVDEETYLLLKNEHGDNKAVVEKARYKILSIENDAPDDIKIDERVMGRFKVNTDYTNDNNADNNYTDPNLQSSITFDLALAQWEGFSREIDFKGTPYVRLVGDSSSDALNEGNTVKTSWVKITKFMPPVAEYLGVAASSGKMTIQKPFGAQAALRQAYASQYNVNVQNVQIYYYFEIKDNIVENKPEFDGKFFVKLEKDDTLVSKVLSVENDSSIYYGVEDAWPIGYMDSTVDNNPADEGPNSGTNGLYNFGIHYISDWDTGEVAGSFDRCNNDTGATGSNNVGKSKDFWEGHNSSGAKIFIDKAFIRYRATDAGSTLTGDHTTNGEGGLSVGGAANGTYGALYISKNSAGWGEFSTFKAKFSTVGTLFRFRNDPNQIVYKIIGGIKQGINHKNHAKNDLCNNSCQGDHATCLRQSIYFKFRKIDSQGNATNEGINTAVFDPRGHVMHNGRNTIMIETVKRYVRTEDRHVDPAFAGVFETEPKENVDLDLYYEASESLPMRITEDTIDAFLPKESRITSIVRNNSSINLLTTGVVKSTHQEGFRLVQNDVDNTTAFKDLFEEDEVVFEHPSGMKVHARVAKNMALSNAILNNAVSYTLPAQGTTGSDTINVSDSSSLQVGDQVYNTSIPVGAKIESIAGNVVTITETLTSNISSDVRFVRPTGYYEIYKDVYKDTVELSWHNCYSFGNGIESDRIRDDFNAKQIDNGVTVSTTFTDYGEERRKHGLIYSGIYNSSSGINELNEFNQAEKITKDLNPTYGSIQALKTRDTDVVVFTEDRVLKVLSNKDALFNADGNTNIVATDRVLGQAVPFGGDYGISNNPESLVKDEFRMYFTDRARGAVLRLSRDGITPISNVGMRDWFRDNLKDSYNLVGTWDNVNGEYNVSIHYYPGQGKTDKTVTFNEVGKGWVSFKSWVADAGATVDGMFFTASSQMDAANPAKLYKHYAENASRNNFYGTQYDSSVTVLLNDIPGSVKSFQTLNYEGTQARIRQLTQQTVTDAAGNNVVANDGQYYNLSDKAGWWCEYVNTNLESGEVSEFIEKEGKWFNNITGQATTLSNLDTNEFSVQGLGFAYGIFSDDSGADEAYSGFIREYTLTVQGE